MGDGGNAGKQSNGSLVNETGDEWITLSVRNPCKTSLTGIRDKAVHTCWLRHDME